MKVTIDISEYLYDICNNQEIGSFLDCEVEELKNAVKNSIGEPCEDCISRQAVDTLVDELARAISDERCCISRGRSTATIMQDILDLPPVTPKQRTGHWILVSDKTPGGYWKCSECLCHKTMGFGHTDWFCPCCGADMRESEEQA